MTSSELLSLMPMSGFLVFRLLQSDTQSQGTIWQNLCGGTFVELLPSLSDASEIQSVIV